MPLFVGNWSTSGPRTGTSLTLSIAEHYSALTKLMNHSDKDVTQVYIVFDANKLRGSMQVVTRKN